PSTTRLRSAPGASIATRPGSMPAPPPTPRWMRAAATRRARACRVSSGAGERMTRRAR
nr:hypothetical protein [Tanacetum cinerariifolium]